MEIVGYIGSFVVVVAVVAVAWGTLNQKVRRHSEAIEGCHMDLYKTKVECKEEIDNCAGSQHAQDTYTKVVRIEIDMQEIKDDLKESDKAFTRYQVHQGAAMARIETQLDTLLGNRSNRRSGDEQTNPIS